MPKVRLLLDQYIDGIFYPINAVPTLSKKAAADLVAAGAADADPAAVAYAETLGVPLPDGAPPPEGEAPPKA